jgi:hypothetical protein
MLEFEFDTGIDTGRSAFFKTVTDIYACGT